MIQHNIEWLIKQKEREFMNEGHYVKSIYNLSLSLTIGVSLSLQELQVVTT